MHLAEGHNAVFYLVNIQIIPTAYKFFTMINKIYNTIIKNLFMLSVRISSYG